MDGALALALARVGTASGPDVRAQQVDGGAELWGFNGPSWQQGRM